MNRSFFSKYPTGSRMVSVRISVVPRITACILALIMLLALLQGAGIAEAEDNPNKQLVKAAERGNLALVEALLRNGADVNAKDGEGETALMKAIESGHNRIVQALIDKGANVNAKAKTGWTELMAAADSNRLDIAKFLIEKGADVNARDGFGRTALIIAAARNNFKMVKLLIGKGANVNTADQDGTTPLMSAAIDGNLEIVKLLFDNHADINAADKSGGTALTSAAQNKLEVIAFLISKGADVNAKANLGMTPLMFAALNGRVQAVKLLLENGADANAVNQAGRTALKTAELSGRTEVVEYLRTCGTRKSHETQAAKNAVPYPATPEGVLEAFVNVTLQDAQMDSNDAHSCEYGLLKGVLPYLARKKEADFLRSDHVAGPLEPEGPNLIRIHIATAFRVKEVKKAKHKTTVTVLYDRLGWISLIPLHLTQCRSRSSGKDDKKMIGPDLLETAITIAGKAEGRVWEKEDCRILHITNDTQEINYDLSKLGKFWRITSTFEPHVSVTAAIKLLECNLKQEPGVGKELPSEEQASEMKQDMDILKKHFHK